MTISLVADTGGWYSGGSNGGAYSSAIDTVGANLLVLALWGSAAPGTISLADKISGVASGNSWSLVTVYGSDPTTAFLYCKNPVVGASHTFAVSYTSGACYPASDVTAWAGALTSGGADVNTGVGYINSYTNQPGSGTPAYNGELLLTSFATNSTAPGTVTGPSGWTVNVQPGTGSYSQGMAYLIQSTASAVNPTWTTANLSGVAVAMVSFQAAPITTAGNMIAMII